MTSQFIVEVFFRLGSVVKHNKLMMTDTSHVNVLRQCADWLETEYTDSVEIISITVATENELIVV